MFRDKDQKELNKFSKDKTINLSDSKWPSKSESDSDEEGKSKESSELEEIPCESRNQENRKLKDNFR